MKLKFLLVFFLTALSGLADGFHGNKGSITLNNVPIYNHSFLIISILITVSLAGNLLFLILSLHDIKKNAIKGNRIKSPKAA